MFKSDVEVDPGMYGRLRNYRPPAEMKYGLYVIFSFYFRHILQVLQVLKIF